MALEGMLIARREKDLLLLPRMANRHGLVAGATGTGKTVSLQVMAEHFSRIGVPVFMADVKGDLAGISRPGTASPKIQERIGLLKLGDYAFEGSPVTFWDIFGEHGHPVRTTVSDMGPLLFSRLLNLNDVQSGVLSIAFRIADDNGLHLLDFKDLRAMAQYAGDHADEFETEYGRVSPASIGAIQRGLLTLEDQGADKFFGEPGLDLDDLMQTDGGGRGMINILAADKLMLTPRAYSTFLLWLMAELFERLPEVGDVDKPRLVFFFDEAHLLFTDAPPVLMEKIEQVVRLIRSKGVGVYFVTQNPLDVPDVILGQLGNRVQHALRAFTPRDQKAVRSAAETFRQNPKVDVETVITQLGTGEALVSFLDEKGQPGIVERAYVLPPHSRIGPITPPERQAVIQGSLVFGHYEKAVDRESAYEMLKARVEREAAAQAQPSPYGYPPPPGPQPGRTRAPRTYPDYPQAPRRPAGRSRDTLIEAMAKSAARSVGSNLGRSILRGVLGSILRGK
ncbi:MAG: ATP-binding protein [Candidatus Aminicenantes bacterium RBG_19FT_COMBO_65_30]|nr:MAG: ATP-binding protein [Candidatus Aminicenantes bacterium RBG_19FT_COMBO_65_30]